MSANAFHISQFFATSATELQAKHIYGAPSLFFWLQRRQFCFYHSLLCVCCYFFFYKNSHINIHKSQVATACMSLSKNSAPSLAKPGDVLHRVQKCNQRLLCGINIIFIVFIFASERIELKFETTIYSMPQSHRVMHFWMPAKSL